MIRVDRSSVPAPESLIEQDGAGANEKIAASDHYSNGVEEPYEFKAYKGDDVRAALKALFHGKCGYCEAQYTATQPVDIEHYRPKGRIFEDDSIPGYWWLAASWDNLLPACIHCNRASHHAVIDSDMTLEEAERRRSGNLVLLGKGDHFPIRGQRASPTTSDLSSEDPLLIDPTRSDPANHIVFIVDWGVSVIAPKGSEGRRCPYGATSIHVYGLNRLDLVKVRTDLLLRLKAIRARLFRVLDRYSAARDDEERIFLLDEAKHAMKELRDLTKPDKPFAALSNQYLAHLLERDPNLSRL